MTNFFRNIIFLTLPLNAPCIGSDDSEDDSSFFKSVKIPVEAIRFSFGIKVKIKILVYKDKNVTCSRRVYRVVRGKTPRASRFTKSR